MQVQVISPTPGNGSPAIPAGTAADAPPTAEISSKFRAGVRPYAGDYYVPDYVPATPICCAPFASRRAAAWT